MTVHVEIVYDANRTEKKDIEVKSGLTGTRLLNAVDKQINKLLTDDKDWRRWNLLSID